MPVTMEIVATIVLIIFTKILSNYHLRYNQEPGPGSRQMFASLTLLASCLYRATIISVMVKNFQNIYANIETVKLVIAAFS